MKAQIVIPVVAGLVGCGIGGILVERRGDPASRVAAVEEAIEQAFQPKILLQNQPTPSDLPEGFTLDPKPPHAAKSTEWVDDAYLVTARDGRELELEVGRALDKDQLLHLSAWINQSQPITSLPSTLGITITKATQVTPAIDALESMWQHLVYQNRRLAEARALTRYRSKPESVARFVWQERENLAASSWRLEELSVLTIRRALHMAGGAVVGSVVALVIVTLLAWLWRFFLARLREVSGAVRGK
jgi:hypothetical protein